MSIIKNMKNNKQDRQNPEGACGVKASGVIGGRGKDKGLKPGKLKYVYDILRRFQNVFAVKSALQSMFS